MLSKSNSLFSRFTSLFPLIGLEPGVILYSIISGYNTVKNSVMLIDLFIISYIGKKGKRVNYAHLKSITQTTYRPVLQSAKKSVLKLLFVNNVDNLFLNVIKQNTSKYSVL